jgi:hypothetical protein
LLSAHYFFNSIYFATEKKEIATFNLVSIQNLSRKTAAVFFKKNK